MEWSSDSSPFVPAIYFYRKLSRRTIPGFVKHQQVINEIRGEDPPSKEELEARQKERQEWQERIAKSELDKQKELDDLFYNDANSGKWMPNDPGTLLGMGVYDNSYKTRFFSDASG